MAYAQLSTRNTSGLHPNLRGLGFLGDTIPGTISAADALQKAVSAYAGFHVNPAPSGNSGWLATLEPVVQSGQLNPATGCTGQAPNANLFQTASGLALGTVGAGVGILGPSGAGVIAATAVPVIGWVIAGAGAIIGLISAIFTHHAAAERRDLNFACSSIPAVNNSFAIIMKAVQNGTMRPTDAANALPEIYSQYMAAGGASGSVSGPESIPSGGTAINDSPWCNGNCVVSIQILAMVFYWQSQFQAMAAQQAAAQSQGTQSSQGGSQISELFPGSSVAAGGLSAIPSWAWLLAAGFAAWAVF
jgi:hypothetical protein